MLIASVIVTYGLITPTPGGFFILALLAGLCVVGIVLGVHLSRCTETHEAADEGRARSIIAGFLKGR
jgi:hypothetical protein